MFPIIALLTLATVSRYNIVCLSVGRLRVHLHAPNLTEIVLLNPGLEPGGHYHPSHCRARHRVAVVVPYRDRQQHLRVLLHNLHPMLMRQQLDYFILVVELVSRCSKLSFGTELVMCFLSNTASVRVLLARVFLW